MLKHVSIQKKNHTKKIRISRRMTHSEKSAGPSKTRERPKNEKPNKTIVIELELRSARSKGRRLTSFLSSRSLSENEEGTIKNEIKRSQTLRYSYICEGGEPSASSPLVCGSLADAACLASSVRMSGSAEAMAAAGGGRRRSRGDSAPARPQRAPDSPAPDRRPRAPPLNENSCLRLFAFSTA